MSKVAGWPFDGLIEKIYLPLFNEKGEAALPFLVNTQISKMSFLAAYKRLPPIEQMPEKEKKEMKKFVINLFTEKNIQEKLEACKIIYTIGTLL